MIIQDWRESNKMDYLTKSYPCRILTGNRITIPKEIMKSLNLKVGDLLMKKESGKAIIFIPCKVVEI